MAGGRGRGGEGEREEDRVPHRAVFLSSGKMCGTSSERTLAEARNLLLSRLRPRTWPARITRATLGVDPGLVV